MNRKHGLLLFISSCIPGCGQMHQGYMKRGVSLLTACFGLIAVAVFLQSSVILTLLPIVWLYAFFDSYNLRNQTEEQAAANPDAFLFGLSDVDSEKVASLCRKRHSVLGWGLILLGVYLFFDTVVERILSALTRYFPQLDWLYWMVIYDAPRLLVTILVIALGVWFIRGPKKARAPEEDIPAFVPPVEEDDHGDA